MDLIMKEKCEEVASILKALANPQRLLILCHLSQGEKTVGQLEEFCQTSQSNISQHLSRMRLQGLIGYRKEANFVYYSIIDPKVSALMEAIHEVFCPE